VLYRGKFAYIWEFELPLIIESVLRDEVILVSVIVSFEKLALVMEFTIFGEVTLVD